MRAVRRSITEDSLTGVAVYDALDRLDADAWASHLAPDVVLVFGNRTPAHGRDAARAEVLRAYEQLNGLQHEVINQWELGDTSIIEAVHIYDTKHHGEVRIPSVTIYRTRPDGLIADYRVYQDPRPVLD